jgi:hypothetical protein
VSLLVYHQAKITLARRRRVASAGSINA